MTTLSDVTLSELRYAWTLVQHGGKSPGIDGITPGLFKGIVQEQLPHIQAQLNAATYGLSPVRGIQLRKDNGGKRLIGIPTVRDRVVQRWLLEDLYPELEHQYADCSYAYRPGRSIHQAVQHLYLHYQYQPAWVIKGDITQFFDSLCWGLLMNSLEQMELTQNHLALD